MSNDEPPAADDSAPERVRSGSDEATPKSGSSLVSIVRHGFNYSLVPLLQRVISLAMLYFYADWLDEAEYGLGSLGDLLLGALVQLLGFNIVGAMTRFYFDQERSEDREAVVSSSTLAVAGLAWFVIAPLALFHTELAPIVLAAAEGEVRPYDVNVVFLLVLLTVPFQLTSQCGYTYLQIHRRSATFAAIQLVKFTFELGLRIYLVGFADWGVIGFFTPVLIGEAACTLFLTGYVLWRTKLRFKWRVLKPMIAYTAPLIPVGILQLGLHYGDRKLLVMFSPADEALHEVGVYDMGYKLGFVVTMAMLGPFVQIFHPWIYGVKDPQEQRENLARVSSYGILSMTLATFLVMVLSKQALDFLPDNKDYGLAYQVVPYIAGGYVLWAVYHLSQIPLYIAKKNGPLVWINFLALWINIALNAYLVPALGFVGSGLATLGTFGSLAFMGLYVAGRSTGIHFQYVRIVSTLCALTTMGAITLLADEAMESSAAVGVVENVAIKGVGLVLCSAWLWLGVVTRDERSQLSAWIAGKLGRKPSGTRG